MCFLFLGAQNCFKLYSRRYFSSKLNTIIIQRNPRNLKVQTPKIQTPKIQTPEIQTPEIQTPEIQTPEIQTPEIKTLEKQTLKIH